MIFFRKIGRRLYSLKISCFTKEVTRRKYSIRNPNFYRHVCHPLVFAIPKNSLSCKSFHQNLEFSILHSFHSG